jgi:outer membrane receptor protein involved in Fe transport
MRLRSPPASARRRRPALLQFASVSLAPLLLCLAGPARAGDAAPAPEVTVNEIVITAQKRSEDIKSVPISVSVLSGGDLSDRKIATYDDLSRAVPGLAFNAVAGEEGRDNIVIRGVSSTSGASTVGLYLDDVSITIPNLYRDGSIELRLPDIERIEVLRGPQGTLYGDSSEGGTIRYITQSPSMTEFGGAASGDVSGTERGGVNGAIGGVVSIPVIPDVLAVRASINYVNNSGWINHYTQSDVLSQKGVNSENSLTAHLTVKWTPTPDLTITPSFFYQKVNDADNGAFYPTLGLWNQDKEVAEPSHDTMTLGSLSVRKTFSFADLTSVTGIFQRTVYRVEDGTYFNSTAFDEFFLDPIYPQYMAQNDSIIGNLPSFVKYDTRYDNFNQELRLSSNSTSWGSKWLKWVVGAYYSWEKVHNTDFQRIPGINTTFESIYGIPMEQSLVETYYGNPTYGQPGGGPAITLFPDDIDESDNRTYQQQQYAVFGQLDINFLPTWKLDLGGRYALAKEDFVSTETGFYQIGNLGYQTPGAAPSAPYTQGASSSAFLPKATLYHDLSADSSVYASAAKGFRLGGPTGPIVYGPTSVCNGDFQAIGQTSQPTHFASDSLWTYELGAKNEWLGRRLTLNVSGYYTDWTNIQQQIYLPTCGYYFTSNVGNARIYGGEVEATARLTRHLRLNFTASANDATITKTANPVDVAVGQHLIDVPDVTLTAGAVYSTQIRDDLRLTGIIDYAYTGHSYGTYQSANPNYNNPAYSVVNLSLGLTRGRYQVAVYAKNALGDRTIIQSPEINTVVEGYTVRPRTVGLTTKVLF